MSIITDKLVAIIGKMPDALIWRFAQRYIAGSELIHGLEAMRQLHERNRLITMDILGEDTRCDDDAEHAVSEYLELIDGITSTNLSANISVKLTQLGLKLDYGRTLERVRKLAKYATENGFFFRMDMEDSTTTDQTFRLYWDLRIEYPRTGTVVQAYLKRSLDDVKTLLSGGHTDLRICKGIYVESPEIAYKDYQQIRENYLAILRIILDGNGYPAIATHDRWLIDQALNEINARKLDPHAYEFQMLYGIGDRIQQDLIRAGHRVRVYVPFGAAWKAYSMRRFRENPTLAWYVLKNLIVPV